MKDFIEDLKDRIDFLRNKNFSLRFRIANIILGDDFTTSIIFANANAKMILEAAELYKEVPEAQAKLAVLRAKHILRDLDLVIGGENG